MSIATTGTSGIKPHTVLALLLLCLPQWLYATSVLQVDMEQLLGDAAVIFEGEVIASEAKWNADNTYISTWITFRVNDVLKGEWASATITQSFAGGTVGDTTLQVSGMVYPQPGESGIYFIENPDRPQVNPMVGWGQGHFRIRSDSRGRERVLTESNDPVQGVDDGSATLQDQRAQEVTALPLSEGVARGLRVGSPRDGLETAISKEDFKAALKRRLSLIEAAGSAAENAGNKP